MRASAKSRARAVPRAGETDGRVARRESARRLPRGERAASASRRRMGKGRATPEKTPARRRASTAAAPAWRESPRPREGARPSRPGSPISPRAAAAAPASASTRVEAEVSRLLGPLESASAAQDHAGRSSQRALDQMWAHLDKLWAHHAQQLRQLQALQSMQSLQTPWAMSRPGAWRWGGYRRSSPRRAARRRARAQGQPAGGRRSCPSRRPPARERARGGAGSPGRAASGDTTSDAPTGEPSESSGESGG